MILQVTPPRAPQDFQIRPRLSASADADFRRQIVLVEAPAGFGKTSLLAQWRREFLAAGEVVAWLTAQDIDEPQRFAQGLALAFRVGAGRPKFGRALLDSESPRGLEDVTLWLAEVAQTAVSAVLIVDRAHLLPQASLDALAYLSRNLPANLRLVISSRANCKLGIDDLVAYGECVVIGAQALQFRLEETTQLVRSRLGAAAGLDIAVKLQEYTEGWPLGLQLVLSIIGRSGDSRSEVAALEWQGGISHSRFLGLLLSDLDPEDVAVLTRVSILDDLHPDLCRFVLGSHEGGRLERISSDTAVFVAAENTEWFRMHSFVRNELRRRFANLSSEEQSELHARASLWLAERGMAEAAALHALASGASERAYELAERSLYEALIHRGRQGAVENLLARIKTEEFDKRPKLLLTKAWSLAISERHEEASNVVSRLLARPDVSDALRCECALVLSGGAIFADDPDAFARLHDPWAKAPPLTDPILLHVHANRSGFRMLIEGNPPMARLRLKQSPQYETGVAHAYLSRWTDFICGLSYLWEGQISTLEQSLPARLAQIEDELGRRHPLAAMTAALLATAFWESGRPDAAEALLANRLDVLERSGAPEAVLLGYRTLARISSAKGAEGQALEFLGGLHAIGQARNLPRLRIASLADEVRLNSHRFRASTCAGLCARIDELLADESLPQGLFWRRNVGLLADTAQAYARIAARDWTGALGPLLRAEEAAQKMRLGRLRIELLGLRAFVLSRTGQDSIDLLREAVDLARSHGLQRVFADAHPALGVWVEEVAGGRGGEETRLTADPARIVAPAAAGRAAPSSALTPKERQVLELLGQNFSNKEIGNAMQVGEETIKWHVKNLFSKLNAASRKQVVMRARLLGFLTQEP
ncbi:MAG: LuxR C-terminal-related transcriptional regulator [Rhodoblastus sp.]|uniref:LuxR C-terminal-related transcriptional regulator n=1 Tax=Rhodoblastus sp. TaxID=1962975 RepID=UPI003F9639DB